jgi:hypothetical protein
MLRHFGRADVAQPANSRAQIAMRLLNEFRDLSASEVIRTVSACDRQWPAEPGHVIEHAARTRLRTTA